MKRAVEKKTAKKLYNKKWNNYENIMEIKKGESSKKKKKRK